MVRQLPIVKIDNKHYFVDDRLQEYRLTKNPLERIKFEDLGDRVPELVEERKDLSKKVKKKFDNHKIKNMKNILFTLLFFITAHSSFSQYIAVKAKYTETRLVDDSPNPPKRQNHLILGFYEVSATGVYTTANLVNFELYIYKEGLQYGNLMGGVLDSTGNNYPGYSYPAPKAVAYYNSLGNNYIDCDPYGTTVYYVNGSQLDVGWIGVSYWDVDGGTGNPIECFTAPNICLPYYFIGHPYYYSPGNINFDWTALFPGPPYNMYNFSCGGSLQLVMRGVLGGDSVIVGNPLPVNFALVRGEIQGTNTARIWWSNLTESDIDHYEIQKSVDNNPFVNIGTVAPKSNNSDRADYDLSISQFEKKALYKIKAVEFSGKIIYSSIISLRLADTNGSAPDEPVLTVFPNPVTDDIFSFRLSNAEPGRYISSIVTSDGKQVKQKMIEHDGGDLTRQIDLNGLLPGIYQFVIRSENYKYTQKFVYVR